MPTNALAPQPSNALMDLYRQNVEPQKRTYGESLLKSFTGNTDKPISAQDFTPEELNVLDKLIGAHYAKRMTYFSRPKAELLKDAAELDKQAVRSLSQAETKAKLNSDNPTIQEDIAFFKHSAKLNATQARQLREAAAGKLPTDFKFGYSDYLPPDVDQFTKLSPFAQTLGHFRYKIDPKTGEYEAYDKYDFNNPSHEGKIDKYKQMSAPQRLISALQDTFSGDNASLGEAYLSGENSIPVSIKGRIR